ncbi:MAG: 2-methylaconitate cis-trans-isomerase PrpF [Acidimicrobiales bacterium]|jgi:2-methylaconitate cis-trans-isomerase PrpF
MTELVVPTTLMRGGTSKGVFVRTSELPPAGLARDRLLLALMGSPDPMQINGLGGTYSSTSKVMAVGPSDDPETDIDYLFAQVAVGDAVVDYQGNCGNLTTAVGPFAIDEGMVALDPLADRVTVNLRNLNTGVRVRTVVPLTCGRAAVEGSLAVAGVPGTGASITTDYLLPGGSVLGSALPTGNAVDRIAVNSVDSIDMSIVDVTSPHVFVRSCDVDVEDLDCLEQIRSAGGAAVGLTSLAVPRLVVVSTPKDHDSDIDACAVSMQQIHHAFPMTGALCLAAAVRLGGTIANEAARDAASAGVGPIRLRHPKGIVEVRADVDGHEVQSVGVTRTARRLLRGEAFVVLA